MAGHGVNNMIIKCRPLKEDVAMLSERNKRVCENEKLIYCIMKGFYLKTNLLKWHFRKRIWMNELKQHR